MGSQRILVTGGAGFLGSHLVDMLLYLGHEVWTFDNYSTGSLTNLADACGRGATILRTSSVTWREDVEHAFETVRPHVVFHLAAQTEVAVSMRHPLADFDVNVTGTVNMLEEAAAHDVRRFVLASTAAIFGDAGVPTDLRMGPDGLPVAPISPYGAAKAAAMLYAGLYDRRGMPTNAVVFSNVYGPRQRPGAGAVNIFARALLAGEPVTLHGDGGNVRDYLYVGDAVRALCWAGGLLGLADGARDPGPTGPVLVGTGVGTTDRELLAKVSAEVTLQTGVLAHDRPGAVTGPAGPGDIRTSVFPRSELARTPLADGLRLTVQAIRKELDQ